MPWDEEEDEMLLPTKARRPRPDTIVGPDRKYRHPAVQAEIERRVKTYAEQVQRNGRIAWLPRLGSGD